MRCTLQFDGGATPNPGAASCAFKATVSGKWESKIQDSWGMIGTRTNNEAEWEAMVVGLERVMLKYGDKIDKFMILGDSELIIRQAKGEYRVKDPKLRQYHRRLRRVIDANPETVFKFRHVYRELNKEMDAACKMVR